MNVRNIDCKLDATIVTNPTGLTGVWETIECVTALTSVTLEDRNLTDDSEPWSDDLFTKGVVRDGKFLSITAIGKVVLYG